MTRRIVRRGSSPLSVSCVTCAGSMEKTQRKWRKGARPDDKAPSKVQPLPPRLFPLFPPPGALSVEADKAERHRDSTVGNNYVYVAQALSRLAAV